MPSREKKSYGSIVQTRACRVLKGILEATKAGESSDPKKLQFRWQEEAGSQKVAIETTLQTLMHITNQDGQATVTTANVREALEAMRDFLGIMQDHRVKTKGEAQWKFTLTLWSQDIQRNLNEFDKLWEGKRSPKAKSQAVPEQPSKLGLKMGAPYPKVRLPDNFVPRIEAFDAVRRKLLAETACPLVVSAIAGLGGLGKSVLAEALVLDAEVQTRFDDGILLVRLGQNPDLQNLLGDWIRTLDKSRESYSATTLEGASNYLHTLLLDKRMLLVVDDVWNGAHVELFRVGGAQCRVLMTTREAQIEGADYHALDVMTEEEAIALVRQKLDQQWQPEQEPEVKTFAKSLGYLPLALDLATNQVRDGLSWADLRSEFETERRAVALEVLDASEAWDCLDENQQRKYSLRACFNLSLRRLSAEQLRQFAWLGVLPEDVSLDTRMAVMLWELSPLKAKKALIDLRNRSFLTSGTETLEGELTYRVHDLMHDTARGLIEQATLSAPIRTLADAHAQLLDRYRQKCDRWDRLPNDGYIHRHLTWHLQQAGREDEIHALMAMSDEQGRNAWFEACDRLGQPAIFVQDVKRGWAIAEQNYEEDNIRSIVLQCRYALITATLNSLVTHVSPELLALLVEHGTWSLERAWGVVESIDGWQQASALAALIPYLSKPLLEKAREMTESMTNAEEQAKCFVSLAKLQPEIVPRAYNSIQTIQGVQDFYKRAWLLSDLSKDYPKLFDSALEQAANIPDKYLKAIALVAMLPRENKLLEEILQLTEELTQCDYYLLSSVEQQLRRNDQAFIYSKIIKYKPSLINIALMVARQIQYPDKKASILTKLVHYDENLLDETLASIKSLQGGYLKSVFLTELAKYDLVFLPDALTEAQRIEDEFEQALLLTSLIEYKAELLDDAVGKSRQAQDTYQHAFSLCNLVPKSPEIFAEVLAVARKIEDEHMRASVLIDLSKHTEFNNQRIELLEEALDAAAFSQWEHRTGWILRDLLTQKLPEDLFYKAIQLAESIQAPVEKAKTLVALSKHNSSLVPEVLSLVNNLVSNPNRSTGEQYEYFLLMLNLAKQENELFPKIENFVQEIEDASYYALALCELAKIKHSLCEQALEATSQIQSLFARADALGSLFGYCPNSLLPKVCDAMDSITSPYYRARAYSSILQLLHIEEASFSYWKFLLHLLSSRKRSDLMEDLATLHPAIVHLGGTAAIRGMVDAMREVCDQWK